MKNTITVIFVVATFFASSQSSAGESISNLEKACAQGSAEGCGDLAKVELEAGNTANASSHARQACDGGAMRGCTILGLIAKSKNEKSEAKSYFKQACERNYSKGCINLAFMEYDKGDKKEARELLKRACDSGDMAGCGRLGVLEDELGNKAGASALMKKSCAAGETVSCTDLGIHEFANGNKLEAERYWEQACAAEDSRACERFDRLLDEKGRLYEHACSNGDIGACYNYGVVREKRKDDDVYVMQVYIKACDGGEARACEAIKKFLTGSCINRRLKAHTECYTDGPKKQLSSGTAVIPRVRVHNPSCDEKEKTALQGLGCSRVGEFEARQGNFDEAEKVFRAGCTNGANNSGCGGLVCIGYQKANQGKLDDAKKLFKMACDSSYIRPGTQDGAAASGCTALPKGPDGWTNKKNYEQQFNRAIEEMASAGEECKRRWKTSFAD